jgi:hypothetical protein
MRFKTLLYLSAWAAAVVAIAPAIGDTITMKSGDTIRGTVRQFRHNHHSTASSAFVIEIDGEDQAIPLHKIETITFEPRAQQAAATSGMGSSPQTSARTPRASAGAASESESDGGAYWLTTSSRKRHNEKCRYYKTTNGRSCGPNDGIPCKVCGG